MSADFWNAARKAVLKAMALGDPVGLRCAIERRAIVVWLREQSTKVSPDVVGLPEKAILSVQLDFRLLQETDLAASTFYDEADRWMADGTLQVH